MKSAKMDHDKSFEGCGRRARTKYPKNIYRASNQQSKQQQSKHQQSEQQQSKQ